MACSWSGGKDSCYALMQASALGGVPKVLVNMMNENGMISRSHGLPFSLLKRQAEAMELPIITAPTSWNDYQVNFINTLRQIRAAYGVEKMVFGDIDLQAHRDWEETVCAEAGITAVLPLWQRNRKELLLEMLAKGMEAMIVSCNAVMGKEFLGKMLFHELIPVLEEKGIDVCGENGEFHTIVTDCPVFKKKILLPGFTKVQHEGYFFLQWADS